MLPRSHIITITQGTHGLFYLTDSVEPGLFIAASSSEQAENLAEVGRRALRNGGKIPQHVVCRYAGHRFTIPRTTRMKYEQRIETTLLAQRHIMRLLNP